MLSDEEWKRGYDKDVINVHSKTVLNKLIIGCFIFNISKARGLRHKTV